MQYFFLEIFCIEIEIEFKGIRNFDTLEEARTFQKSLGDRFKRLYKVTYPDYEWYTVEYEEGTNR